MAKQDSEIKLSLIDGVTTVLTKIQSEFVDLGKTLSDKQLAGATLDQLEARLKAVRSELSKTDPRSARFVELAQQAGQLDGQIAKINGQLQKYSAAAKNAAAEGGGFLSSLTGINQGLELASKGVGLFTSAARALGGAVSGAASVEDALARISIRTQGTIEEQKALQDAIQAGVQGTRFSAEEAANALLLLVEDGANASEAMDALGAVLGYAQANAQSAAQATAGLGAVLDTFGEKPAAIGALADALQATAVAAGTSTQALQEGLAGVGVQAEQAGLTLNETIAALGVLATRGIEGGAAAKALNTALAALTNPASTAGKALADAGLEGKTFSETLAALSRDSTAAEAVLSTLGAKPRAALRLLLAEGGADLKAFAATINDSAGASEKASETLNNTFNGALARIQNQLGLLRDELLTPILQPIAQEVEALSGKLRQFAESPQFDLLVQQFTKFATDGVKAIGDFIVKFDFAEALGSVQKFITDAGAAFDQFVTAVRIVADAVIATRNSIVAAFEKLQPIIETVTELSRRLNTDLTPGLVTAQGRLNDVAEASDWAGVKIGGLSRSADDGKKRVSDLGRAAATAAPDLRKTGDAAAGVAKSVTDSVRALDAFGNALDQVGKEVEKTYPAYDNSKEALVRLAGGATEAAIGLERLQIATLASAQAALVRAGQENTATFRALTLEIGKAEERIRQLQKQLQDAGDETDKMGDSADKAGQQLQNLADNTDDLADSTQRLTNSNSQVRESFGNIGEAASSVAVDMGNLSEEYIRQSLAAAGASKSIGGYIDTLNRAMNAGIEQQRQVADRLAQQEKLLRGLDEEAQALDRLRQQYPAIAENELKKLYDAEKRLVELRERKNRVTREGAQIEREAADAANAAAGGLNFGRNAGQQQNADQGGGGGSAGGASIINNFNIAGVVTDDIARELAERVARFQRLAR